MRLPRTASPLRRNRAGVAANILVFLAGTVLILAGIIGLQKSGLVSRSQNPPPAVTAQGPAVEPAAPPVSPVVKPTLPAPVTTPVVENVTPPPHPPKPAAPAFIGDAQWKRYHRPDCKYVGAIAEGKRVPFATAAEAFDKGFIPCKFCNPEVPAQEPGVKPAPIKPVGPPGVETEEPQAVSTRLVGDAERHRYHRADCRYVKLIKPGNVVSFRSPAEALDKDFYPCRACNPDLPLQVADLPNPVKVSGPVVLTDKDKHAMFKSLYALKAMLKGISSPSRPYEVLSDRYGIPVSTVEAVETEGKAGRWPKE